MQTTQDLLDRLAALRRGFRGWMIATTALVLTAALSWTAVLFVMTDWAFQWGQAVCWAAWALTLIMTAATVGALVYRWRHPMTPENLCRRVESIRTDVQNRLINIIQFASSEDPREQQFAKQLMADSPVDIQEVRSLHLFPRQLLSLSALALSIAAVLTIILATINPVGFRVAMTRLLFPMQGAAPYTLTQIVSVTPGDSAVVKGQTVTLEATFAGVIPQHPKVILTPANGPESTLVLLPTNDNAPIYTATTPALYESLEYRIAGGDARSPGYRITVQSPPALKSWTASVQPPAYMGKEAFQLMHDSAKPEVPQGATIDLQMEATLPLQAAAVRQDDTQLGVTNTDSLRFTLATQSPVAIDLTSQAGLTGSATLPLTILPDLPPDVSFATAERQLTAKADDQLALPFRATDDYGLRDIACELMDAEKGNRVIASMSISETRRREATGAFGINLNKLGARPGSRFRFRLVATDHGPDLPTARRGVSSPLEVVIPLPQEERREQEGKRDSSERTVAQLIQWQQENLKASRQQETSLANGVIPKDEMRQALLVRQVNIRDLAADLIGFSDALGDLQPVLNDLLTHELQTAIERLDSYTRSPEAEALPPLQLAIADEEKILSVLRGLPQAMEQEFAYQDKADLLAALQKLVATQRRNLKAAKEGQRNNLQGDQLAALVNDQERLADEAMLFLEAAGRAGKAESEDDFARQVANVKTILEDGRLYEKLLTAADQLSQVNWPGAIQSEEEALRLLEEAMKLMNKWRVDRARQSIADASKTLKDITEQLAELEEKQTKIVEQTRDLTKRGKLDQPLRDELAKMDAEQKDWLEKLEKMAQDLYQFPELPVANDLNSKMREVYEDVEQAAGSEHAPTVEIAVQKEDGLLEAIKNTKERVEDVEMWLPDVPDNIKWDLESFDAMEFPEMPLVDLPDELEDIVGDLLDQDADIDMASQDSTGNQMMADAEMGWAVMDGPMPNFSAKGKSGNTKPNDNEMTGRSGAGREGQAVGELVEDTVKGLEGRQTHARKTNDPFQKGQVEEEDGSTLDARATGGGKLGGESENIGMFGDAPRRDLHMQPGGNQRAIRQDAEALYTTARLLYLNNTQNLGDATQMLQRVERTDRELEDYESLQQRVLKRLQSTHTELTTGAVLPIDMRHQAKTGGGQAVNEMNLRDVDETYRGIVADYYKNLGE